MAGNHSYESFTQYVKVEDSTAIVLHTHVLPSGEAEGVDCYRWWSDRHNQELMLLAHEVVFARATCNLASHDGSLSSGGPQYEFKRGDSLRALFAFQAHNYRQHLVLPTQEQLAGQRPPFACMSFVNDYGRRVIPFLNSITSEGSGFRVFRLLPDAIHAYVDPHELTSTLGIFKVLAQLDPTHTRCRDITSYFQPPCGRSKDREVGGPSEEEEQGPLPQVPVAGLKKKRLTSRGRKKGATERQPKRHQGNRFKHTMVRRSPRHTQQPTITESIANIQVQKRSKEPLVSREEAGVTRLQEENLSSKWVDEFVDFSSQPTGPGGGEPILTAGEELTEKGKGGDNALPLLKDTPRSQVDGKELLEGRPVSSPHKAHRVPSCDNDLHVISYCTWSPEYHEGKSSSGVGASSGRREEKKRQTSSIVEDFDSFFSSRGSPSPTHVEEAASDYELNNSSEDLFADDHTFQHKDEVEGEGRSCSFDGNRSTFSVSKDDIDLALFDIQTPPPQHLRSQQVLADLTNSPRDAPLPGDSTKTVLYPTPSSATQKVLSGYDSSACPERDTGLKQPELLESSDFMKTVAYPTRESFAGEALGEHPCAMDTEMQLAGRVTGQRKSEEGTGCWFAPSVAESDFIMISSDEEDGEEGSSVRGSQSQSHDDGRKNSQGTTKKKTGKFNLEKLFKGKRHIRETPKAGIQRWLRGQKDNIVSLYLGHTYSRRHEDFKAGAKKKASLRYQLHTGMFCKDQVDVVSRGLLHMFCAKSMKLFDYVMSVLYPECLIRLLMDFYHVDFDKAERLMFVGGENPDEAMIS